MAHSLDRDTGGYAAGAENNVWLPKAPGLVVVEHKFPSTAWNTQTCVVFFKGPFTFLRPAKWFVSAEQFDVDGSPALTFDVGTLNSTTAPTAVSSKWAAGVTTLGRAATCSTVEDSTGFCGLSRSIGLADIGVNVTVVPATPATYTNLKMWMGVWFVPW